MDDNGFCERIIFSDESTFHLSGKVFSLHKMSEYEPPRAVLQHVRDSPKINVFCVVSHTKSKQSTVLDLPTQTLDGHLTNAGLIPVTQKLLKCFIPFIWGMHTLQSLVRVIFAHDMVFDSWYPFDVTESPIYEIVNLIQLLGSMVLQSIFTAFLGLFATVIEISCSQIEKLKISLKNIGEQDIHKELIQCIRHHQQVLK
ncbi:hypothetical protein C0J52_08217 [Blattella germanica]|nr:hypothetical protein C0J52_08217 [Blattella germanica]